MLSEDLLKGAGKIAEYLGEGFTARIVYHLAEKRAIPVVRLHGNATIYARKSELDRHFSASPEVQAAPEATAA